MPALRLVVVILLVVVSLTSNAFGQDMEGLVHEPATRNGHAPVIGMFIMPVKYDSPRPTSGVHWPLVLPAGMYYQPVSYELLVHNLEHGNIVVYFNPDMLSEEHEGALKDLTKQYQDPWFGVLAVADPTVPVLELTAWEYRLSLDQYDSAIVLAFIDRFGGRGPENPVR